MFNGSNLAASHYRQQTMSQANGMQPQSRSRKRERPANNGSKLLSDAENGAFFSMLGYDCYSLAAGVVQLLRTDPRNPRVWIRHMSGVVSLVKDYGKRAYFLRLYDVFRKEFKWQQMLYKNFRAFPTTCPNLLHFEGDECVYGLNFTSREEADNFKMHLDRRYQQEQKTHQKKVEEGQRPRAPAVGVTATPTRAAPQSMASKTGITTVGTTPTVGGGQLMNLASASKSKKKTSKKDKKSKIRKEDISNPTNFQHKAHIGWDANGGFSQETFDSDPMDNSVRDLLKAAGENPDRMTKEEIDFTYRFLDQYAKAPGAIQTPQRPVAQAQAPPPPVRREASMGQKAQRPPSSTRPPGRPLPQPPSGAAPPRPAPPPVPVKAEEIGEAEVAEPAPVGPPISTTAPPPPPPPPVATPAAAAAAPATAAAGRGNLLSDIQSGVTLRSAAAREDTGGPAAAPSRDDVMAQIRQGAQLRPVDRSAIEGRKSAITPLEDVGGIAGALARALQERRVNLRDSEDSEDEEEEANDSEWETD